MKRKSESLFWVHMELIWAPHMTCPTLTQYSNPKHTWHRISGVIEATVAVMQHWLAMVAQNQYPWCRERNHKVNQESLLAISWKHCHCLLLFQPICLAVHSLDTCEQLCGSERIPLPVGKWNHLNLHSAVTSTSRLTCPGKCCRWLLLPERNRPVHFFDKMTPPGRKILKWNTAWKSFPFKWGISYYGRCYITPIIHFLKSVMLENQLYM